MAEKVAQPIVPSLRCAVCHATDNLKRCGYCKQSFYCSRDHQMQDWARHKTVCKEKTKQLNPGESKVGKVPPNGPKFTQSTNDSSSLPCNVSSSGKTENGKNTTKSPSSSNNSDISKHEEANAMAEANTRHVDEDNVGMEFDGRPYRNQTFHTMNPKTNPQDIAKVAVETLVKKGYSIIDGVFTKRQLNNALADINQSHQDGKFDVGRLAGGRTSGERDEQVVNSDIRRDEIFWVEGSEANLPGVRDIVSTMDSILVAFNDYLDGRYFINGRTKVMLACYPGNGTYYRRHVDNPNRDGRVVTCILYLNENWNPLTDGGVLRVFPRDTNNYLDVAPLANRLLFFWSDRRNPHEVQPAFKTRYAITVWYMDEEERRNAKRELAKEEMEQSERRGEYDLTCYKQEKATLCKKIDDTAEQAIASLSLEELQAMSTVLADQPNPEAVLGQLGIAPHIRGKLIQKLKQM